MEVSVVLEQEKLSVDVILSGERRAVADGLEGRFEEVVWHGWGRLERVRVLGGSR